MALKTPPQPLILVVRGGAIGDFVLTLPVLAALRSHFPNARVGVVGYPQVVDLAIAGGLADEVWPIEARSMAGFFARGGPLDPVLQALFCRAAVVVSFLYDPDGIFRDNVARCSSGQFIAGPHRPEETEDLHAAKVFLRPLERLAIFDADPVPRLVLRTPADVIETGGPPIVACHPGSGSEPKNWPADRWLELLDFLLNSTPAEVLLVGGEAEGERLDWLALRLRKERVSLARSLPLRVLASRLALARVFVGHDSGITHLAAALGLPVLALWGPSKECIWRPPGERVTIIRSGDGLSGLSVRTVGDALLHLFAAAEHP